MALAVLAVVSGCGNAQQLEGSAQEPISGTNAVIDNTNEKPWLAPVGMLLLTGGTCSGTLAGRTKVLTAGHCFNDEPAANPGWFDLYDNGPIFRSIVSWVRLNNGSDRPHDIAIATLATPVEVSIVPTLPRIFTGGINDAFASGLVTLPAIMVGFGGTIPEGDGALDGNRRWGNAASDLRVSKDPCGDIFEGDCNDDYEIEQNRVANPQIERGDSGGPLYATDRTGVLVIIGVASGSVPRSVWAPTGAPGGANNGQWIVSNLGGDPDGDGIPETADNCPASLCAARGRDASTCSNPDQSDDDSDGVGDACDNCRKSVCDGLAARGIIATCVNPSQSDLDPDGLGDLCDLCPDNPSYAQRDADGDGVGDACDLCPNAVTPFPPCVTNADCPGSTCVKEPSAGSGKCADLPDADDDAVPDACDACPSVASPDRGNTNDLAEQREKQAFPSVQALPDACDPVPIVRVQPQEGEILRQLPFPGDGQGPDDETLLDSDLWVGADPTNPSRRVTTSRRVTYRHCDCVESGTGTKLDFAMCVRQGGQCDWNDPVGNARWTKITIMDPFMRQPLLGADGWSFPQPFSTSVSTKQPMFWEWRADALAGRVATQGVCPGSGPYDCQTHGAIFTGVEAGSTTVFSARDALVHLRDTFLPIDTPNFTYFPHLPVPLLCWRCAGFLAPGYKDPDPDISSIFDRPTPIFVTPTRVTGFLRPGFVDLTTMFSPSMRQTLASDVQWLPAVESRRTVRASTNVLSSVHVDAALLDRNYSGGAPQYFMAADSNFFTLDPLNGEAPGHVTPILDGGPRPLTGVTGAYSQIEGNVYMVGGRNLNRSPSNVIWRWSIEKAAWSTVAPNTRFNPSSTVLATTYDSIRQHLYVLDVDDTDQVLLQRYARLLRFDLASGNSAQVLRVPYNPLHQHVSLATFEDGTLALVAVDALTYTAWRIDARPSVARFLGVFAGVGAALDQPVMGEDRLYLPVNRFGQFALDELTPSAFLPGAICSAL